MKKILVSFIAFMLIVSLEAQAQGRKNIDESKKAQAYSAERLNLWSTDVEMNLFGNNFNNFRLNELNVRRYLNDRTALRFTLGFGMNNDKTTNTTENEDPSIDKNATYYISHSNTETINRVKNFKVGFGYEYHRDIFDKVDIYTGGELGFETFLYSATVTTNADAENQNVGTSYYSRTETTYTQTDDYYKSDALGSTNMNNIFIGGFAGADVYFYKNIYVGAELGLKYVYSSGADGYYETSSKQVSSNYSGTAKSNITSSSVTTITNESSTETGVGKNVVTVSSTGASTTTTLYSPVTTNKNVASSLGLYIEPSLHIGIRF